jgi:hypothetical protein
MLTVKENEFLKFFGRYLKNSDACSETTACVEVLNKGRVRWMKEEEGGKGEREGRYTY